MGKIIKGIIITPTTNQDLSILNPGFLVVSNVGVIEAVTETDPQKTYPNYTALDHSKHLIVPGFIDLHNHLPQYAFAGLGDGQLLPWLEKYTFPREQQFKDPAVAKQAAEQFFTDLVSAGTTTSVTYVTVHQEATDIAFEQAEKVGLRAIIGKVMMDQNTPLELQETTTDSLKQTEQLIQKWHGKHNRLFYAITPRFAITCTPTLIHEASNLQKKYDTYMQTHLAENKDEIALIKKLFPTSRSYTDVYHQAGMLGPKTLMAHCIYLDDEDLRIIHQTNTKIVHCPTSNRFVMSGIMPTRNYLNNKLSLGLGTDAAGGYSISMLHEMREALETSKTLSIIDPSQPTPLTLEEVFYMATLGGAQTLGLETTTGSLEIGKAADIAILDPQKADQWIWENNYNQPLQLLAKCMYATKGNSVIETWVQGKKINP